MAARKEELKTENAFFTNCLKFLEDKPDKQVSKEENYDYVRYNLPYQAARLLKVDNQKGYVIMYTYDTGLVPDAAQTERLLFFVAHVNNELVTTGLELDLDKPEFRYKSSQGFPRGVEVNGVLNYFSGLHDRHFPTLRNIIIDLQNNQKDPLESAKQFIKSIKN
jgi:hypothetical protein